ncbi:3'-5' exonuclease, partial [Pseudomonas viridiflava]|uniref:3'-5' exonuclease n=1 Tax=Pseudomonas viridiflava TaxID=33069 RepID=UPI0024076BE9
SIDDSNRNRIKSLRKAIKQIRTISLNDLAERLVIAAEVLLDTSATVYEQTILHQVIQDPEAIKHYLPAAADQIQCMRLHKSKGLEFDIVIHLDLVDWVFPKRVPGES